MEPAEENFDFDLSAKELIEQFQEAQTQYGKIIKEQSASLFDDTIKKFKGCEKLLQTLKSQVKDSDSNFDSFIQTTFVENFEHALYFTLADIHKRVKGQTKSIRKYMSLAKKTEAFQHAVPAKLLYTEQQNLTLQQCLLEIRNPIVPSPEQAKIFFTAHECNLR